MKGVVYQRRNRKYCGCTLNIWKKTQRNVSRYILFLSVIFSHTLREKQNRVYNFKEGIGVDLVSIFSPQETNKQNVCFFRYIQCQLINAVCSKLSYCREWCCSTLVKTHLSRNLSPFFFITLRKHMAVQLREKEKI